jgi:hypothetical protein
MQIKRPCFEGCELSRFSYRRRNKDLKLNAYIKHKKYILLFYIIILAFKLYAFESILNVDLKNNT